MAEYLTITEVANKLCITRQAVHKAIVEGRLPAKRIGESWLIRPASVAAWARRRAAESAETK